MLAFHSARAPEASEKFTDADGGTCRVTFSVWGEFDLVRSGARGGNEPIASISLAGTGAQRAECRGEKAGAGDGKVSQGD